MGNNNSLSEVRQEFLNACALHSLIQTSTIERLLGEAPLQGPPKIKYSKLKLFAQCKDNFERVYAYIEELENLDGNAGAIVGAVTEVRLVSWNPVLANPQVVHIPPLRDTNDDAPKKHMQPFIQEVTGFGYYFAVHVAYQHIKTFMCFP